MIAFSTFAMMYSGCVSLKPPFPPLVRADLRALTMTTSSGLFGAFACYNQLPLLGATDPDLGAAK